MRKLQYFGILIGMLLLVGCHSTPVRQANQAIDQTERHIAVTQAKATTKQPPVIVSPGFYVDTTPVSLKQPPGWLNQKVELEAQGLPLSLLMAKLLRSTPANAGYDPSVNTNTPVSLQYTGPLKGALDVIATKTGYAYQVNDNIITWSNFISKTFSVAFMPGSSEYLVGQSASPSSTGTTSTEGNITVISGHLEDQQYSTMQGQLSVWDDLTRTLDQLKSKEGQVSVSQATTSVTVYDHPRNVDAIARYIKSLNRELSQQVSLQVEVAEVELNKDFNLGIDWNLVQHFLGASVKLQGALGSAVNLTSTTVGTNQAGLTSLTIGSTSNAILQALETQGKLRVVTQPRLVTMNNQVAEVRITKQTGYLQSVSTTIVANQGSQTSLTPGVVTDGFTLYLLPKIQGNRVYLQISSTLSTLTGIEKVSNQPDQSEDTSGNFQAIQVPTLAEKDFNQRSVVGSGSTLIIAGFKQLSDQTKTAKLYGVQALGGEGSQSQNIETLLLITPTILRSNDNIQT